MKAIVQEGLIGAGLAYLLIVGCLLAWSYRLKVRARKLHRGWSGQGFDGRTIRQRMNGQVTRRRSSDAPVRDNGMRIEQARFKILRMRFFCPSGTASEQMGELPGS